MAGLFWFTMLGGIILDQVVKGWMISFDRFWVLNKGVAFSIGAGQGWLGWMAGVVILVVLTAKFKNKSFKKDYGAPSSVIPVESKIHGGELQMTAWSFLIGGGVSNLIDRVLRGGVVDFIQSGPPAGGLPVFNLADIAITVGVGLLIVSNLPGVYAGYMKLFKLTESRRDLLAEKIMDTGNLAIVGTVFALIAGGGLNALTASIGVGLYLVFMFLGYMIKK